MHEPVGRVQFVVFEKFTSAYLFQIAREKSFDYFLIIYKKQFLSRFSTLRDKWSVKLLQLYWKKIWHVNSSVKIHSLSPSHVWKLSSFLSLWKADLIYSELKNLTTRQNKLSSGFNTAFFTTVCRVVEKKLRAVFKLVFAEKELFNPAQLALTKMQRNKAKV